VPVRTGRSGLYYFLKTLLNKSFQISRFQGVKCGLAFFSQSFDHNVMDEDTVA
jgi:hypothetical protein